MRRLFLYELIDLHSRQVQPFTSDDPVVNQAVEDLLAEERCTFGIRTSLATITFH
ncbi:hypothetical protein HMPREF0541_01883 [Lacticaseibacillus rhamnosus ATCC 21052]|nr:hypothetical protein HMPREF0541_01883 [Lacticaseibacillus rhamnosus ATCC 21052]